VREERSNKSAVLAPGPAGAGTRGHIESRMSTFKERANQPASSTGCALLRYMRVYGTAGMAASSHHSILCGHADLPAAGRSSRSLANPTTPPLHSPQPAACTRCTKRLEGRIAMERNCRGLAEMMSVDRCVQEDLGGQGCCGLESRVARQTSGPVQVYRRLATITFYVN
jgi:hypothetical protein